MSATVQKVLIAVAILLGLSILWQRYQNDRDFQSWPTAPANLISAEVAQGGGTWRHPSRYYIVETQYTFTVNGTLYSSNLNRIGERRFGNDKDALLALAELKSRPALTVHYKPTNPDLNALSR